MSIAEIYNGLGMVFLKKGLLHTAFENVKRALLYRPRNAPYIENAALILLKAGHADAAMAFARRAVRLDAGSAMARAIMAQACRVQGNTVMAVREWERYRGIRYDDPRAVCALIELYHEAGRDRKLAEMVRILLGQTVDISLAGLLKEFRKDAYRRAYVPDEALLTSIVRTELRRMASSIEGPPDRPAPGKTVAGHAAR